MMNFVDEESVPPEWINSDFLKEVLEFNGELKGVLIDEYETAPAVGPCDHFASIMFRTKITYSTDEKKGQTCSVIIKAMPTVEGMKLDFVTKNDLDYFGTEIFMYSKVLGKCDEILKRAGCDDKLVAKILYYSVEPRKVLVFEDLKELGYAMPTRMLPNDEEAKIFFSKLGKYHAAVFKLESEGHEGMKRRGTMFNAPPIMIFDGVSILCDAVRTLPGFEIAVEKLSQITHLKLFEKCKQVLNTPGSYNVLNHGDYHVRNMMFKTDKDESVEQAVLVDFQMCNWGSPAFDLYYIAAVIPYSKREKLFKLYFDTFIDVLVKSGFQGNLPTYELLQKEMKRYQCFDLHFLCTSAFFMTLDPGKTDPTEMMKLLFNKEVLMELCTRPKYLAFVKELLPILLEDGVLDEIIRSN